MRPPAKLLVVASAATLMSAVMVAAPTGLVAQAAPAPACSASLSQGPPIYSTTELTVSASGLDPNESDFVTSTFNGSSTTSTGEANSAGVDAYTFMFPAGSWEYSWVGRSSGATCSVSWTVLDASATTTTAAPTTTSSSTSSTASTGSSTTTSATAASTTTEAVAAQAVAASPAFTG